MQRKYITLYPTDPFVAHPGKTRLEEMLLRDGFFARHPEDDETFILGEEYKKYFQPGEHHFEESHIRAWVEDFGNNPQLRTGSNVQHIQSMRLPSGKITGDAETANELIRKLQSDPHATWNDPQTGSEIPVYTIDFDHYVAFGNHFIGIDLYERPAPELTEALFRITGIQYKYALYLM